MKAIVTQDIINKSQYDALLNSSKQTGAIVSFSGLVREVLNTRFSQGEAQIFELEHYPAMTEAMLEKIAHRAIDRFALDDAIIVHRVGKMHPSDVIVYVLAASKHRQAAFDGANFMMDYLKTRAPFWKKEASGKWVDAKESDEDAFARWNEEV